MRRSTDRAASFLVAVAALSAGTASAQVAPNFPGRVFELGVDVRELAPGDFDGDGDFDLAAAVDAPGLRLIWSDGGRYDSQTVLSTGVDELYDVATADVDGDGDADVAGVTLHDVWVWRNDGFGNFVANTPIPKFSGKLVAFGDFDGNGTPDLAVDSLNVSIYLGTGLGGFAFSSSAPGGSPSPLSFAVADWNSDGRDDLALGGVSVSARVYLMGPGASFGTPLDFALGGACTAVAAADADGDGHRDLACAVPSNPSAPLAVLLGNGAGGFGTPVISHAAGVPRELCLADLDGDGRDELAATSPDVQITSLLLPIGDGLYAAAVGAPASEEGREPQFVDADGDGDLDLVTCAEALDRLVVSENLGLGSFELASLVLSSFGFSNLAAGDLDGDGLDELVTLGIVQSGVMVFEPDAGGGLKGPRRFAPGAGSGVIELADVDDDGHLDALVAQPFSEVLYLHGDGQAGFDASSTFFTGTSSNPRIAAADFDGDGHVDVAALVTHPTPQVEIHLGDGTGAFAAVAPVPLPAFATEIAAGRLDGDADVDLLVGLSVYSSPSHAVWFANDGTGAFGPGSDLPSDGSLVRDLSIGDLDHDGHPDIVVSTNTAPDLTVFWGDSTASFAASTALAVGGPPLELRVGDLDGDGIEDVAWSTQFEHVLATLAGDAGRALTRLAKFAVPQEDAYGVAIGRFDADGALDIAVTGGGSGAGLAVLRQVTPPGATAIYCSPKQNSLGCIPYLGWSGVPSASAGTGFTISAHGVLSQKVGLFIYTTSGTKSAPFQGGTLCINAPIKRTALQIAGGNPPPSDCSGSYSFDFNAYVALDLDPKLDAGAFVAGQFWSRDPGFAAPNNVGLTAGIRFVLQP